MNKSHYTEIKHFTIYALTVIDEHHFVYVGKTTSPRLSAIYSRHICGGVAATESYFDKEIFRPQFYILEHLETTAADAYKHVIAWLHLFLENGFTSINHDRTTEQAENLLPQTSTIADTLCSEPLSSILDHCHVSCPKDADLPSKKTEHSNKETPRQPIQMNIRIDRNDQQRFDAFRHSHKLNQREAFSLMLDQVCGSPPVHLLAQLNKEKKSVEILQKENNKLKTKLAVAQGKQPQPQESKAQSLLQFFQKVILDYLELLLPDITPGEDLDRCSYRKYIRRLPSGVTYAYPQEEGFMLLSLEAVLWGNSLHRTCFLIGLGEDGQRYKLRHYPKNNFFGIPFLDSPYARKGAWWHIGCQRAKDGAMDIVSALPVPNPGLSEIAETKKLTQPKKSALDDIIQNAANRR